MLFFCNSKFVAPAIDYFCNVAIVKPSGILSDLNGKLNGSYFARSGNGTLTLNNAPTIKRTQSPFANVYNLRFVQVAESWKKRNDSQRNNWNNYAKRYKNFYSANGLAEVTGFTVYMRVNYYRRLSNQTLLANPQPFAKCPQLTSLTYQVTSTLNRITYAPATLPANINLIIRCTKPLSKGITPDESYFHFISRHQPFSVSPEDFQTVWNDKYGLRPTGHRYWIKVFLFNQTSGIISPTLTAYFDY